MSAQYSVSFVCKYPSATPHRCFHDSPPKIQSITIVENPFPDIVPRITAAEKRAQQRAREASQKEREEAERRRGAKKCDLIHADFFALGIAGADRTLGM